MIDGVDRRAGTVDQVLDRPEYESLLLEQALPLERRRYDGDAVVTATT